MIGLEDPRQGEPAYPSIVATSARLLFDYNLYPPMAAIMNITRLCPYAYLVLTLSKKGASEADGQGL